MEETKSNTSGAPRDAFVRRLGEIGCGRDSGRVGTLDLLARAGLPVPEGVLVTRRAHEEFLWTSGILQDILAAAREGGDIRRRTAEIRLAHASSPAEGELGRAVCEALIGLNAKAVVVLSEDIEKGGLMSIPEVWDAVRDVWLSPGGLERQVEATARSESLPTWPVLVQRELSLQYTGWSTIRDEVASRGDPVGRHSLGKSVVVYDVEPAAEEDPERTKRIASFTLEARTVLGEPVKIQWGLEDGRWYVFAASSPRR
jgi:hypothetical protein